MQIVDNPFRSSRTLRDFLPVKSGSALGSEISTVWNHTEMVSLIHDEYLPFL